MKKMRFLVVVMMVLAGGITAYGQPGPPEPIAKKGKVSLGVGYFYYSDKWAPSIGGIEWTDVKIMANQPYVQASYGFMKNAEAYLRFGAGDFKATPILIISDPALSGFKSEFTDGLKPFVTVGIKKVFNITPSLGIGPFLQVSRYSNYKDLPTGTAYGFPATREINLMGIWECSLGVALQGKISKAILYAGPFAHAIMANIEDEITSNAHSTLYNAALYRDKNIFGGFLGVRAPLGKAFTLEVEGQMKSKFSGGALISYSF